MTFLRTSLASFSISFLDTTVGLSSSSKSLTLYDGVELLFKLLLL